MSAVLPCGLNPSTRTKTEDTKFKKLQKSIQENGQIVPVIVVEFDDGTYRIADGHRRHTALETLGETTIKALVQRATASETAQSMLERFFKEANDGTKAFNGRDKLNVALRGGPIFDASTKSNKLQLESLFTDQAERDMLINKEITATVLSIAKKSTRYVLDKNMSEDTPTFRNRLKNHIYYFLRNNAQQAAIAYMRLKYDPEALRKAIDANRPVPQTSLPSLVANWKR